VSTLPVPAAETPPRQRLQWLCDPGTLEIISPGTAGLSVEAASGRVGGHRVFCYAQDVSISGGAIGSAEADVIVGATRRARESHAPVIGFLESAGARLQEGVGALAGFGRIFYENVAMSGRAPQISVITGTSAGGGCYSPALTDFVIMNAAAHMFLTGPKIVRNALGEQVTPAELGGAAVHGRNGVCDFVGGDDRETVALVRELLWPPSSSAPATHSGSRCSCLSTRPGSCPAPGRKRPV
jgi:acetyl-CoA carboxylase carboxyltransferase component